MSPMILALAAILGSLIGAVVFFAAKQAEKGDGVNFFRGQNIVGAIYKMSGAIGLAIAGGVIAFAAWALILANFLGARG
jgi:prolipoprotein diacylglyceryltransferase